MDFDARTPQTGCTPPLLDEWQRFCAAYYEPERTREPCTCCSAQRTVDCTRAFRAWAHERAAREERE